VSEPREVLGAVRAEVARAVVGQEPVLWGLTAALLLRGHVILEGVPGVAKTLTAKAFATALDLGFARIQFTPDLMPSDVTGSVVYESRSCSPTS
jgi:MoxR-like ATPase